MMRVQKWILLFEDVLALFPIFDITSYDFRGLNRRLLYGKTISYTGRRK